MSKVNSQILFKTKIGFLVISPRKILHKIPWTKIIPIKKTMIFYNKKHLEKKHI